MPVGRERESDPGDLALINAAVLVTLAVAHICQQSVAPERLLLVLISVNLLFWADIFVRKYRDRASK